MKSKSKLGKALAVALSAIMVSAVASSCMAQTQEIEEGTIAISIWDSGWGRKWADAMAEQFQIDYPQYKVQIFADVDEGDITNVLPDPANEYDIIFGCNSDSSLYKNYYEPMDDIINSKCEGESKTIGEKLGSEMLSLLVNSEGHYDKLCFGTGYYTFVYKSDLFEDFELSIPNTTNEFLALLDEMREYDIIPFIHFNSPSVGYSAAMMWTWAMQYAGIDAFYEMSKNPTLSALVDDDNGILQGLEVLKEVIGNPDNNDDGSGLDFGDAQTAFLAPREVSGRDIAMMINGAWLENEISKSPAEVNQNIKAMKTPVLSSIIDKCATINDDKTLSAVISAIDAGKTSYDGVSKEDFNRIATARKLEVSNAPGLEICIPNYSEEMEGAKEFVKFFFSDKGLKIWFDTVGIRQFASFDDESIVLDTSKLSVFQKSQLELAEKSSPVAEGRPHSAHKIFISGNASLVGSYGNGTYAKALYLTGENAMSASDVWENIKDYANKNWESWWRLAGLTAPQA